MCGDSTSIDAVDKLMDGQKADMVFTDPPYGVDYKGINNDSRNGLEDLLRAAFANYLMAAKFIAFIQTAVLMYSTRFSENSSISVQ
jgi:DNA modification methylase